LPKYQIRGITFDGVTVDESVQASSPRAALRYILIKYGTRLKKPYEIFIPSQIEDVSQIPNADMLRPIEPPLPDEDVLRIAEMLKSNEHVDEEEYLRFKAYFRPMIRRAVRDLWNDTTIATHDDVEQEMYAYIITEFMPKYSSKRGRIRTFIRVKVVSRLKKMWKREKYVNADKASARPKHEILQEYARSLLHPPDEEMSLEGQRTQILEACKEIVKKRLKLTLPQRRTLFQWIVRLGMHQEFLRHKRQIQVLEIVYGQDCLTEVEAAAALGVVQQTLNINKNRAERNFFDNVEKYFMED